MLNCSTTAKWAVGLAFLTFSVHAADAIPSVPGAEPAVAAADATAASVPAAVTAPPVEGVPEIPVATAPVEEKTVVVTPPAVEPAKGAKPAKTAAQLAEEAKTVGEKEEIDLSPPPRRYSGTRDPIRQLGRGVANVLTGVCEVPFNIYKVNKEDGDFAAITYGVFRGIWRFGVREVVGVGEVITFPFGWKSIVDPEFFFEPAPTTDWRVHRPCRLTED